ncbi:hypothetical protein N7494_007203 [Penicillium frequentans]|uniref:Arrestin-like N-terminal domain-containing protein n=1 Tax=Penicillium frequentans TaxID=3151616 RepID=A0AAD6CS22_9EURO|nr:hypothetical protein N7494_007203 [Penicillium glabrum]
MIPQDIAHKDDLRLDIAAPLSWRYSPGDTIIGSVVRNSPIVSPEATLKIWLTGTISIRILRAGSNRLYTDHECYINKWTLLKPKEYLIFSGPLHHPENSKQPLSWSFSLPIPSKPKAYITDSHQPHATFVPFDQNHPAYNILPGTLRACSSGYSPRSAAAIEYELHARLYYDRGGSKKAHYATLPITLRHSPGGADIHHISKGGSSYPRKVRSQRLLPEMKDKELSFRQKTNKLLASSKVPVFWFKMIIESPPVVQVDNPHPLPIRLSIATLLGNDRTSKIIEDVPQRVQINYVKILVKSSTTVIAPGGFSSSVHTGRQDSVVDLHFEDAFKNLESPLVLYSSVKANENIDLGNLFQLVLRRNGLYTNGKRCSSTPTRYLFPDCCTFILKHTHQFEYRINLTIAGETQEVEVFVPVRIIEAA